MASRAANIVRASLVAGLALVAIASFVRPFQDPPRRMPPRPTAEPPPVHERRTPDGLLGVDADALFTRMRRSEAKGTVVGVWASWCGSCKEDVPLLLGLHKTFGASIDVIIVSVDEPESQPVAAEMLRGFGAPQPFFVVDQPLDAFKTAVNPRWPGMLPATFLFDGDAKLRYFWGGPVLEDELVPLLRRYLAGEHIDGEANFALAPGAVTPH